MKRILLSLVLISSAFACKAMSDEEKFQSLVRACDTKETIINLTVKQVNSLLVDNNYVTSNPIELVTLALTLLEEYLKNDLKEFATWLNGLEMTNEENTKELYAFLAMLRIIEIAHEYGKDHTADTCNITIENVREAQRMIKSFLKRKGYPVDDSNNSSVISSIFSKNTALTATSLLALYFGWHYFKNSEKAK